MSFWMDKTKEQSDAIPVPAALPPDVIVSPDTHRAQRIPPGQSRTKKWPVLDASGPPKLDLDKWTFAITGLVHQPIQWSWQEFLSLPRTKVFSDFHCVTRWSRLGNIWEGVSMRELLDRAGGLQPEARFVVAHGYDRGFTTNVPVEDLLREDVLVALTHDGEPITLEHGGPARLIVPHLYAWKSAKWLSKLDFTATDQAGFWEKNGYHMRGDPWQEERYGW